MLCPAMFLGDADLTCLEYPARHRVVVALSNLPRATKCQTRVSGHCPSVQCRPLPQTAEVETVVSLPPPSTRFKRSAASFSAASSFSCCAERFSAPCSFFVLPYSCHLSFQNATFEPQSAGPRICLARPAVRTKQSAVNEIEKGKKEGRKQSGISATASTDHPRR